MCTAVYTMRGASGRASISEALHNLLTGKKKTFCTGLSQKVLIRRPFGAPLMSRIALFRAIVLTAAPDPEAIYSPLL